MSIFKIDALNHSAIYPIRVTGFEPIIFYTQSKHVPNYVIP